MRSTCRNICRVRAGYVLSTRKMWTRIWAPSPWMGVIIEEHIPGGRLYPQGGSSLPLYVPSYLCTYHQSESIGTRLIKMKIRIRNKPASSKKREVSSKDGSFNQNKVIELPLYYREKVKVSCFVVCVWPVALTFELYRSIFPVVRKQRQRQAYFCISNTGLCVLQF